MTEEPKLRVGLMDCGSVTVTFHEPFLCSGRTFVGTHTFTVRQQTENFIPTTPGGRFTVEGITIGVGFHWQQHQSQTFAGALQLMPADAGRMHVINVVPVEVYLKSVISSEMNSEAPEAFLRAHAVISRSWAYAMISRKSRMPDTAGMVDNPEECIKWYDREDHSDFDLCADDHCQRYQGTARINEAASRAVDATRGKVLTCEGELCDARFSKCCGGAFEEFESCWGEGVKHPYLAAERDAPPGTPLPDLRNEAEARKWILTFPPSYCNTADTALLRKVLNSYDLPTTDFYRWEVELPQEKISQLVGRFRPLGKIVSLKAIERGPSGRIKRLHIKGTEGEVTVGKELEIRRWLSDTHLYSSAFVVEGIDVDANGIPGRFILHGAGWGHGVGLCQIGAAVMAVQGATDAEILSHYYPGSSLQKLWQ